MNPQPRKQNNPPSKKTLLPKKQPKKTIKRDNFAILLDNFLSMLSLQYANYSSLKEVPMVIPNKNSPNIIYKQYMNYYVYRIICKYLNIFKDILNLEYLQDYLLALNIKDIESICVGLRNKMPKDKNTLDRAFKKGINLLKLLTTKKIKYVDYANGNQFKSFIKEKLSSEVIDEDIKNLIKLIPDLSVS